MCQRRRVFVVDENILKVSLYLVWNDCFLIKGSRIALICSLLIVAASVWSFINKNCYRYILCQLIDFYLNTCDKHIEYFLLYTKILF